MNVEYPTEAEIETSCGDIVSATLPNEPSRREKLRAIYIGPGFRVLFNHSGGAWVLYACAYLLQWFALSNLSRLFSASERGAIAALCYPLFFFVFSYASCRGEEQDAMLDLKNTMHYDISHIVSLRMFYVGIATILTNVVLLSAQPRFWQDGGRFLLWKLCAAGTASLFLFAVVSLYLYRRLGNSRGILLLLFAWGILAAGCIKCGRILYAFLFETLPLAIHLAVAASCVVLYLIYLGKVGKPNADTLAY